MVIDFKKIFYNSPIPICVIMEKGELKEVNKAFEEFMECSYEESLKLNLLDFIAPRSIEDVKKLLKDLKIREDFSQLEIYILTKTGKEFLRTLRILPEKEDGSFYIFTEKKMDKEETYSFFYQALEASPAPMLMVDHSEKIVYVNNETLRIFGYVRDELLHQDFHKLVPAALRTKHRKLHQDFIKDAKTRYMGIGKKLMGLKKNGSEFPIEIGLNPVNTPKGTIVLCALNDLTERYKKEAKIMEQQDFLESSNFELEKANRSLGEVNEKLADMVVTDSLTGLRNRRFFFDQMELLINYSLRYNTPFALVMIDVDHFKSFNDNFGHQTGDTVLQTCAWLLTEATRSSDIVARYGGEEFSVILPNTKLDGAIAIAEKIRSKVEAFKWKEGSLTMSLGVSAFDPQKVNPEDKELLIDRLVKEADDALYASKNAGRNRVTSYEDIKK